jgi:phosphatidylglycerol---prolipoprotein diacylglyceryl transferase
MHPILFRIPLPKTQIQALYIYLAVIALGLIYAAVMFFVRKDKSGALGGLVVAGIGVVGKLAGVIEKIAVDKDSPLPEGMIPIGPIPIYSYGVMLGLSLVVGWYLTLTLAEKDGLPKETMANNYVVTAIAAIAGSRILYVLTNLNEFSSPIDIFALRRGGLVAYGGFLGGFLGSLFYLRRHKIPLLPWADVAVPSLASGLMITRIGCYLFGCDFGRPLCGGKDMVACASPEAPPTWLQRLGTFPQWEPGMLHEGSKLAEGAPAWTQHKDQHLIDLSSPTSLPVHPTQLYESLLGAALLGLLLWARTRQKFRGQIFILFTFAYGIGRYLIEILRDDNERGSLPFSSGKHVMIPLGLAILAVGFTFSFAKLIKNTVAQRVAQVGAFVPAVALYVAMAPASYGDSVQYQWSTSQFVAITTGFAVCVLFSVLYKAALAHPESAMHIPLPDPEGAAVADERVVADADADEEEDSEPAPKKAAPKKGEAAKPKVKAVSDEGAEEESTPRPKKSSKVLKRGAAKKLVKPKREEQLESDGDGDAADEPARTVKSESEESGEKKDDEKKYSDET